MSGPGDVPQQFNFTAFDPHVAPKAPAFRHYRNRTQSLPPSIDNTLGQPVSSTSSIGSRNVSHGHPTPHSAPYRPRNLPQIESLLPQSISAPVSAAPFSPSPLSRYSFPALPDSPSNPFHVRNAAAVPPSSSQLFRTTDERPSASPNSLLSPLGMNMLLPADAEITPISPIESPFTLRSLPASASAPSSFRALSTAPSSASPKPKLTKWERMDIVLDCIKENFGSFPHFLDTFLYDRSTDVDKPINDPRSKKHIQAVSSWLSGGASGGSFKPVDAVQRIYLHPHGWPKARSVYAPEGEAMFDGDTNYNTIRYARVAVSIWATQLVGMRCEVEVGKLGHINPKYPEWKPFLQSSVNDRMRSKRETVTEADLFGFSMDKSANMLKKLARTTWFITQRMSAPRRPENGEEYVREHRPHPYVQVLVMSCCAVSRNRSANAYFALPFGALLFASKVPTNVKRLLSCLGVSVHPNTVRDCMTTVAARRRETLTKITLDALLSKNLSVKIILDNCQKYGVVHEHGIGKTSKMLVGTAATATVLEGAADGAFLLESLQKSVIRNSRAAVDLEQLLDSIDYDHLNSVSAVHVATILCESVPCLKQYLPALAAMWRSGPLAKRRMPAGRKTRIFPLGPNSQNEMEVHGMKEAQRDFNHQAGFTSENVAAAGTLLWYAGDVGSVLSGRRVMDHLLPQACSLNAYESFENMFWVPGLFHAEIHELSAISDNALGQKTSSDPSTISRASAAAGLHTPKRSTQSDYYPTRRTLSTIFRAQILDLWDLHLTQHGGLEPYFTNLATTNTLPTLSNIIARARLLVDKYMSLSAYHNALSDHQEGVPVEGQFPEGSDWSIPSSNKPTHASDSGLFIEKPNFAGDRVLANSIIFRRDFLLYHELTKAVSGGDTGRVVEALKPFNFMFAGAGKNHYAATYMDLHLFLDYDASPELRSAILDNWLVNLEAARFRMMLTSRVGPMVNSSV
ncbi:hypothetical protein C8F01DRAFT_1370675 [Mycena amicta]|nr:hypothetical protein C8F01DRAFT_1370675 [Mycena amicta]